MITDNNKANSRIGQALAECKATDLEYDTLMEGSSGDYKWPSSPQKACHPAHTKKADN